MTLADRLRSSLAVPAAQPPLAGDFPEFRAAASIPAAVLIGITDRSEPGVILTVRRENLRMHAGQVAFPGGRVDPGEEPVAAAIREAQEELDLNPSLVELVGCLDDYRTVTGYVVTPAVAVVPPDLSLTPHDHEVADWFEAPLEHLLDPVRHELKRAVFAGRERRYWQVEWQGRQIWGATAAILINLSRRLQWS